MFSKLWFTNLLIKMWNLLLDNLKMKPKKKFIKAAKKDQFVLDLLATKTDEELKNKFNSESEKGIIRKAMLLKKNNKLIDLGFSPKQIEVLMGISKPFDVLNMINPKFTVGQLKQLKRALIAGMSIYKLANINITEKQMKLIIDAYIRGNDITTYTFINPKHTTTQIKNIIKKVENRKVVIEDEINNFAFIKNKKNKVKKIISFLNPLKFLKNKK